MRVGLVTRDYPPRYGGMATYVEALARHLRALGVEVEVFVGGGDVGTLFLARSLSSRDFNVIHVASAPYGGLASSARTVVTVYEPVVSEWPYYGWGRKIEGLFAVRLEQRALKRAKRIIAISTETKRKLVSHYGLSDEKVVVVPLGVDPAGIDSARKNTPHPMILTVSRLDRRKNLEEALQALAKLESQFRLVVVGGGPERGRLEHLAHRLGLKAEFVGPVPQGELRRYYDDADIFLSTSRSEGFGLSLLEAMAHGCAVLASDIQAHRELIPDSRFGILYKSLDELTERLRVLTIKRDLVESLGSAAQKLSLGYSWEQTAKATLDIYHEVARS
jgi:glycosyltransferase involved in cell wall biosynthesis